MGLGPFHSSREDIVKASRSLLFFFFFWNRIDRRSLGRVDSFLIPRGRLPLEYPVPTGLPRSLSVYNKRLDPNIIRNFQLFHVENKHIFILCDDVGVQTLSCFLFFFYCRTCTKGL